jgi:hypothetical protein
MSRTSLGVVGSWTHLRMDRDKGSAKDMTFKLFLMNVKQAQVAFDKERTHWDQCTKNTRSKNHRRQVDEGPIGPLISFKPLSI